MSNGIHHLRFNDGLMGAIGGSFVKEIGEVFKQSVVYDIDIRGDWL